MKIWRWLTLIFVLLMLLTAVWFGLKEGVDGYRDAESGAKQAVAVFQILYGIAAVAALIALFTGARWGKPAIYTWAVFVTITGALAPVVWGESAWTVGVVSGCLTLVIALLTVWAFVAQLKHHDLKILH